MSFNWAAYLALARELAGRPTTRRPRTASYEQAQLRSAISRAYYAAFCRARNHLRDNERLGPPGPNIHRWVINQFQGSSDRARIRVGRDLYHLRDLRNTADYDDIVAGLPSLTQSALRLAERVLAGLDKL